MLTTHQRPKAGKIYAVLRSRIGSMSVGVPLPSMAEVRSELGAGQATVERALALLEAQGLIERKPRKGIFVADPLKRTGEIAIVMNGLLIEPSASPVYGLACSRVRGGLQDINPRWKVKLHLGSEDVPGRHLTENLDLLDPAVLPRLRGVLSFHPLLQMETDLSAAGVPVVYLGAGHAWGCGVFLDDSAMVREGVRRLAEAGCRDVRLLLPSNPGMPNHDANERNRRANEEAARCGIGLRVETITFDHIWTERQGYELFMRLWRQGDRPDGVMVQDDVLCGGVLRAILELRLEMPRDLKLVTHANRGIELPHSRPVSRLEFDVAVWADRAVRMLETRIRQRSPETPGEMLQPIWVQGETT
ncbi:MAG: substrate-binding domain-containing protein [Kiritimatiellae bacterium]|nr:substrate-binding domain-containing protein [Kiritimatiellia bacterium]